MRFIVSFLVQLMRFFLMTMPEQCVYFLLQAVLN